MASSNNSIAARIAALKASQEASQERPSSSGSNATAARKSSTSSISARIAAMQGVPVMGMPMPGGPSRKKTRQ